MILDTILKETRAALLARRKAVPREALQEQSGALPPPLSLTDALRRPGVSIIAEVKRASPSRGALDLDLSPGALALAYAGAGADAISVLTEPRHFQGRLEDLRAARQTLTAAGYSRPLLRKDFLIDPYQVWEARAWGADAVLLIAAALDDRTLGELLALALSLGLSPLVEVHDEAELARVAPLHPPLIGINNRNLKTMAVDLAVTRRLRPLVSADCLVVSESGLSEPEQMREMAALGVDAVLIGTALVTASDPPSKLCALKEAGR